MVSCSRPSSNGPKTENRSKCGKTLPSISGLRQEFESCGGHWPDWGPCLFVFHSCHTSTNLFLMFFSIWFHQLFRIFQVVRNFASFRLPIIQNISKHALKLAQLGRPLGQLDPSFGLLLDGGGDAQLKGLWTTHQLRHLGCLVDGFFGCLR